MPGVGSIAASTSLLVAGLDLSLVRMLRQAMQTADLSAAAASGTGHYVASSSPAQAAVRTITRTERVETPAASFEPCPKHHLHPRLAELQPYICSRPVLPADSKCSIQPPWKVLPWPKPINGSYPPGHRMIKIQLDRTDVNSVGRTLDLFI
jgi:hypothetical protein